MRHRRISHFVYADTTAWLDDPFSSLVCMITGDQGGSGQGGGAGGGGQGGGQGGADLSQAQLDAINGIVKSQLGRLDIPGMVATAIGAAAPKLVEQVTSAVKAIIPQPDQGGGDGKGDGGGKGKGKGDDGESNEVKKLAAQVAQLQEEGKQKSAELANRARQEREKALHDDFASAVAGAGVKEALRTGAIATVRGKAKLVVDGEGNLVPGPDGKAQVEVTKTEYGNTFTDKVSVAAFVQGWAKTEEGKEYMPPPRGAGSGVGARMGGGTGQGQVSGGRQPQGSGGSRGGAPQQPEMSDAEFGMMVIGAETNGGGGD